MDEKTIISAQVATVQRDRLADLAAANERSLSGEVRLALDVYLRLTDPPGLHRQLPDDAGRTDVAGAAGVQSFSAISSRDEAPSPAMTGGASASGVSSP